MNTPAFFAVDDQLCIGCSRCIKVCPQKLLYLNDSYHSRRNVSSQTQDRYCRSCQHCLAVCPRSAIRICGKEPGESRPPVSSEDAAWILDSLVMNRRSHRHFLSRDVDPSMIRFLIDLLADAPANPEAPETEFVLVDDRKLMDSLRRSLIRRTDSSEQDPFFGAPCLLVPHAPPGVIDPDGNLFVAAAYFELLCASRGLGAVLLSISDDQSELRRLLEIPSHHRAPVLIAFGWPAIPYARGVQRHIDESRIQRLKPKN